MAEVSLFQHFLQHLFPYYYEKYLKLELDFGHIEPFVAKKPLTENLFDVITKAMFGVQDLLLGSWMEYLDEFKETMTSSAERYILHVTWICYAQNSAIKEIYEKFIIACALVTVIGVHTYRTTGKKFYKLTSPLLIEFFKKALKKDFKKRGGWKCFENYLMLQDYIEYYKSYSDFLNCKDQNTDIPSDIKEKMRAFVTRRKYFYLHSPVEVWKSDSSMPSLVLKVVNSLEESLLTELDSTTLDDMPSASNINESSISNSSSESSQEEEPSLEVDQSSKTSNKVDLDQRDISDDTGLENLTLN